LVHGAWAEPAGWDAVAAQLTAAGYPVVAPGLTLRGLDSDTAHVKAVLAGITGPIILVGHSYGGAVITNAAAGNPNVKALVYIAAFAPDVGETVLGLAAKNLGSVLPLALIPAPAFAPPDLVFYLNPLLFRYAFTSNEVSPATARAMAKSQRPLSLTSLTEKTTGAAWRTIPSWFLVASKDHAISPATQRFEAQRAGSHIVEISSGHAAMVSHPDAVTALIVAATP
jgi:pimeloyl-ACP methyl ester carboxylesterase